MAVIWAWVALAKIGVAPAKARVAIARPLLEDILPFSSLGICRGELLGSLIDGGMEGQNDQLRRARRWVLVVSGEVGG